MVAAVRSAWADWLTLYPWDVFGTLTWRSPTGEEGIVRQFRSWLRAWGLAEAERRGLAFRDGKGRWRGWLPGQWNRGRGRPVGGLGVEPHRSGRLHAHTLLRYPDAFRDWNRSAGWRLWFDRHGLGRLEPPRTQGDVARYVAKYVCKPESDLVLSDSWDAVAMPQRNSRAAVGPAG